MDRYAAATAVHLALAGKLQNASLNCEDDAIAALTPRVEEAARTRAGAREAMRLHEAAAGHSDVARP
jgi:hypothetical protein